MTGLRDLRMPWLGACAWAGGLAALAVPLPATAAAVAAVGVVALRRPDLRTTLLLGLLVAGTVAVAVLLRDAAVARGPVPELAGRRAAVDVHLEVSSDPVRLQERFGTGVRFRALVVSLAADGTVRRVRAPVLVFAGPEWRDAELGSVMSTGVRLAPSHDHDLAALVTVRGPPDVVRGPGPLWRAAARIRAEVRDAVAGRPAPARALVPALVMGDDTGLDGRVEADFQTAGLTHLLAVSGTNLTLVAGFLLIAGRWCGVRRRGLLVLGAVGIVGFVLLARTEPSVVRAAAMGAVGLLGLSANGRDRGPRALGAAVVGLLLWDPWLAVSVGFALSVLATAGILFLAPGWRDAMSRWMPEWLATAIAVPAAAQLVCTPVVAAISGQVSLVAVLANLCAGPLVAPATVCGLLGGVCGLVFDPLGRAFGWLAAWSAAGIIWVAERAAASATPAVSWETGVAPIAFLAVVCAATCAGLGRVLARRSWTLACCSVLGLVVLVPLPSPGWPPAGWVLAACDVGQGDALALNAGDGQAVVVDAGPDPALVDRCLDRLDVEAVPLVVLTHFHADHVDGLSGVYDGRTVGEVDTSPLPEPADRAAAVWQSTRGELRIAGYGEARRVGQVTLQVLGPLPDAHHEGAAADEGSGPNNASVVLLVEVRGVRTLLTGDVEPEAQRLLARSLPGLAVDVLKIPHHGSRFQDLDFLTGLGARVAIASAGEGNDYGHPAPETLDALAATGAEVLRTDRDGDVVVCVGDDGLTVVTRG